MNTLHVSEITHTDQHLLAYLVSDTLPMLVAIEVSVEGNVANWSGQVLWNGDAAVEMDVYFPLLSRVHFDPSQKDRAILAQNSGSVQQPLQDIDYANTYLGNMSAPVFLLEGGGRGLAVLDDNRADYAADPGAASMRTYVIGNTFPPRENALTAGADGPFFGIRHRRVFKPISAFGGEETYNKAEKPNYIPMKKLGDAVDLGPVRTFAYNGNWKVGASWLRAQRQSVPFRVSPARWYQETTFISEDMGDDMLRRGQTFYNYTDLLAEKRLLGSDLFAIPGFHDPELLGTKNNFLNRGDYYFAAQNLGGPEAARKGIDSLHRAGGHVLYYVEGLIIWKRSRIGRTHGQEWALMNADGTYVEEYQGFYHMCAADKEFQEWIAHTLAEIVRTTGVDGFFIDSLLATDNHRCFNPAHHHPHPDVWNWGVRQMLLRIREEVDKVNPNTILFSEGSADLGRESVDGFISHTHQWTDGTFDVPLVRFLYPQMRAFESWGTNGTNRRGMLVGPPQKLLVWNAVNGHRIYAHNPVHDMVGTLSLGIRHYYDTYPEIVDNEMSALDVGCENCIAQMFEGASSTIVTVGNPTDAPVKAEMSIPVPAAELFDRVDTRRISVKGSKVSIELKPWEFRAFEIRP
jgi:hypothetical protein